MRELSGLRGNEKTNSGIPDGSTRAAAFVKQNPSLNDLTPTERRVLKLIAANKTSKEIAAELFISHRTVENHRANICRKL